MTQYYVTRMSPSRVRLSFNPLALPIPKYSYADAYFWTSTAQYSLARNTSPSKVDLEFAYVNSSYNEEAIPSVVTRIKIDQLVLSDNTTISIDAAIPAWTEIPPQLPAIVELGGEGVVSSAGTLTAYFLPVGTGSGSSPVYAIAVYPTQQNGLPGVPVYYPYTEIPNPAFPPNPYLPTVATVTLTGLTNGVPYPFFVAYRNEQGDGTPQQYVGTPGQLPDPPTITAVVPGNLALEVLFSPPVNTGYAPITWYEVIVTGGFEPLSGGSANVEPIVVGGLQNGVTYEVRMRSWSAIGRGAYSAPYSDAPAPAPPFANVAYAISDRAVRVKVNNPANMPPVHVSSTGAGDALNPRSWGVIQEFDGYSGGRPLTCMSVLKVDQFTYDLLLLEPFQRQGTIYRDFQLGEYYDRPLSDNVQVSGQFVFEDETTSGVILYCKTVLAASDANNTAKAVKRGYATKDIANVSISPLTSELGGDYYEFLGGTLQVNSAGDYVSMSGEALVRKLIMRRLISSKGDFFHLPDYGANLMVKGVFSTANLPNMAKDIERQVLLEPEVEAAKVTLTYQAANSILVVQVQARMRSTGQQTGLTLSLPLAGTKSF